MTFNTGSWVFALALVVIIAAVTIKQPFRQYGQLRERSHYRYIQFCKDLIRCLNPRTSQQYRGQARLGARARPNSGLRTTFGLSNAFTTDSEKIAYPFINDARNKLRKAVCIVKIGDNVDGEADWTGLVKEMQDTVREALSWKSEIVNLADVVQSVTLKVSLKYLFDLDNAALNDREAIQYVAKTINILWLRFKAGRTNCQTVGDWIDETRLHHHLSALTGIEVTHTQNAMNFILPAYETMWRAVLRGVLEIYFRNAACSIKWQAVLNAFMDNPTRQTFSSKENLASSSLNALDIVKEVLRLYPPTRRIYRQFSDDPAHVIRSADIERCHRNPLLARDDPECFRPERWIQIRADFEAVKNETNIHTKRSLADFEEDLGFMPFANWCPAGKRETQGFGFKMVGLLTMALCRGFDSLNAQEGGQKWRLQPEAPNDELPVLGTALKSGREDYLSLVYRRVT